MTTTSTPVRRLSSIRRIRPSARQQGIGAFNVISGGWDRPELGTQDIPGDQVSLEQGGFAFAVILHEFGHAHGLAHPHDNGGGSDIMPGVFSATGFFGVYNLNQGVYTVMSYNDAWQLHPDGPSPFTICRHRQWLVGDAQRVRHRRAAGPLRRPRPQYRRQRLHAHRRHRRRLLRVHLGQRRHRRDRLWRRAQRLHRPHRGDARLFADRRRRALLPEQSGAGEHRCAAASPSPTAWSSRTPRPAAATTS